MKMTSVCRNLPTFALRGHADTFTDFERLEIPHEYLNDHQIILAKILLVPFKYLKCCQ